MLEKLNAGTKKCLCVEHVDMYVLCIHTLLFMNGESFLSIRGIWRGWNSVFHLLET